MTKDSTYGALDDSKRVIVAGILRPGTQEPEPRTMKPLRVGRGGICAARHKTHRNRHHNTHRFASCDSQAPSITTCDDYRLPTGLGQVGRSAA
jgi:hypothetical protein